MRGRPKQEINGHILCDEVFGDCYLKLEKPSYIIKMGYGQFERS